MIVTASAAAAKVFACRPFHRRWTTFFLIRGGGDTEELSQRSKSHPVNRSETTLLQGPQVSSVFQLDTNHTDVSIHQREIIRKVSTTSSFPRLASCRPTRRYRVFLAVGSNLGDCFRNINDGLSKLCDSNFSPHTFMPTDFVKSSFLYRTAPMYVTDQPSFWNGVVEVSTDLEPHALLKRLKEVEQDMGRTPSSKDPTLRNGPRPLDLDILFCYDASNSTTEDDSVIVVDTPDLTVPHPRIHEREFVLGPLVDIAGRAWKHPTLNSSIGDLLDSIKVSYQSDDEAAVRILPLPQGRSLFFNETLIMGILNVTPDSFSDGGKWTTVERAVNRAMDMIREGAAIIDIGGESTRPGATEISVEEQIARTVPVIERIRERSLECKSDIVLSIDTRHAAVARAAVNAGADIVNDVSGGTFDKNMLTTVTELGVPMVLMHMRGTPETMKNFASYDGEGGVVNSVVHSLIERSQAAEEAGIPKWMQVLDLGIGFAKDVEGNLSLLKHYSHIRSQLGNVPLLLGTSRKGFIGKITGEEVTTNRDFGTVGSCVAALCLGVGDTVGGKMSLGCNILRVHNVSAAKQAALLMDAVVRAN